MTMRSVAYLVALTFSCTTFGMQDSVHDIQIDAKPVEDALREFVAQSGMQILFDSNVVTPGMKSDPVQGRISADAALAVMLRNSGLKYQFLNSSTVAIVASTPVDNEQSSAASAAVKPSSSSDMLPVQSSVPEVLIKGSRSLNADIERTRDDVRPYVVIDREAIERSAAHDVSELISKTLTMNYAPNMSRRIPGLPNVSSISLRGLDNNETLILIDGRRATTLSNQGQEAQSDLNGIPLSAIERIEVLPATASGIYGGNATGGVVNVILRRSFTGLETAVTYENQFSDAGARRSVSLFGGSSFEGGRSSVLVNGTYLHTSPFYLKDSGYILDRRREIQDRQLLYNRDNYYRLGAPILGAAANISTVGTFNQACSCFLPPPNLRLKSTGQSLGAPITSIPEEFAGSPDELVQALQARAGSYNTDFAESSQSGASNSSLLGEPTLGAVNVTLRRQMAPSLDSFLEISASRNEQQFSNTSLSALFTVPRGVATNPFDQDVLVNAPIVGYESHMRSRIDSGRALAGIKATIFETWSAGLEYSFNRSIATSTRAPDRFAPAARTAVSQGRINLFGDPQVYVDQLREFILPASEISPSRSTAEDVVMRFAGPLRKLPSGEMMLSLLIEGRDQEYDAQEVRNYLSLDRSITQTTEIGPGSLDSRSAYAELRFPLASGGRGMGNIRSSELQVSVRYDKYDLQSTYSRILRSGTTPPELLPATSRDFDSLDPSIGFKIEPMGGVMFRGSWGTGFRPPFLVDLQPRAPIPSSVNFVDPKRNGEGVQQVTALVGGNPDLNPEQSRSWSVGLVLKPLEDRDLRLAVDRVVIKKTDNIYAPALTQRVLDEEDLVPGIVLREAPAVGEQVGKVTALDLRSRNGNEAKSVSYDVKLDYSLRTSEFGTFAFGATGTKLVHNITQSSPTSVSIERAGTVVSPEWGANASFSWTRRNLTLGWRARYYDSFWLSTTRAYDSTQGSDHLPSQTYFDAEATYEFSNTESARSAFLDGTVIRLGVKNVFNTRPRYYALGGYADQWVDPVLASYFVMLRKSFF